jgi:hypothetical protein
MPRGWKEHAMSWSRVDEAQARAFAASWYAAWNAHDLDRIMAHYAAQIEHSSPFIRKYNGTDEASLRGAAAVRDYFDRALERNPTLRFDPLYLTIGVESVTLVYRRMTGDLAAELFAFDEEGKVVRSISHYDLKP